MPDENTTTHESTETKPSGAGLGLDTSDDSQQAETDAKSQETEANPEVNKPPDTEIQETATGAETETDKTETAETETTETETEDKTSESDPAKSGPVEFRGRTFTNLKEFMDVQGHSADETIRQAGLNRDNKHLIMSLQKRIVEMEDAETERPYPELKSKEELDEMSNAEQNEYFHNKHRWEDAQAQAKSDREKNRKGYEDFSKQMQASMAEAERIMTAETDTYPKFVESKPYRDQILMASPYLNNRPNTAYDTWLMAMGMMYLDVMAASKQETAKSKANAKAKAQAAATQTGEGGTPRTVKTGGAGEESDAVKAYRQHHGPVF